MKVADAGDTNNNCQLFTPALLLTSRFALCSSILNFIPLIISNRHVQYSGIASRETRLSQKTPKGELDLSDRKTYQPTDLPNCGS